MARRELLDSYVFDACSPAELDKLAPYFHELTVETGRPVYSDGDEAKAIYFIVEGIIEISKYCGEDDKVYHICLLQAHDIFGIGEMFFDAYYVDAVARTKTRLLSMKKEDFLNRFLTLPGLNRFVLDTFAHIIKQRTLMLDWQSSRRKFDYFLYFLCSEYGSVKGGRIEIGRKITHETIASTLNLSREHVTRMLGLLAKDGIVEKKGHRLVVDKAWFEGKHLDGNYATSFKRNFKAVEPE